MSWLDLYADCGIVNLNTSTSGAEIGAGAPAVLTSAHALLTRAQVLAATRVRTQMSRMKIY